MFRNNNAASKAKDLKKQSDKLVEELKNLDKKFKNGLVDENEYNLKKHKIEREIVEVMDRLAQMRFLSGKT